MDRIINRLASTSQWPDGKATFYQDNQVIALTLGQLDELARKTVRWLMSLGLQQGDRIGIIARNRLEWALLDLAAIKMKVVTAGFDRASFAPDPDLLRRYRLKLVFTDVSTALDGYIDIKTIMPALVDLAPCQPSVQYTDDDVTTIKFTSGSTGRPKGLAARSASIDCSINAVQSLFQHKPGDKIMLFLPLSLLQQRYWFYSAFQYGHDVVLTSYEFVFHAIKQERPTVIMGVPSFYDAVQQQIENKITASCARDGSEPDPALRRRYADVVLGGNVRYLWTGSAPAKPSMLRFFTDLGISIYEGYGMNETCIVAKNHPNANKIGSVGQVVDGKQVMFDDRGMLIVKSRHPVNVEYAHCDDPASQKVFSKDGDVLTGDVGYMDEDGFLYITGRVDDIVSLGNGKNVFVRPIEDQIKTHRLIAECIVMGAGQPYLTAIISPAVPGLSEKDVTAHMASINERLTLDERIGRFVIAKEPFSIENGLLSSQYKPKRKQIVKTYGARHLVT